jgi:hypothetical protein
MEQRISRPLPKSLRRTWRTRSGGNCKHMVSYMAVASDTKVGPTLGSTWDAFGMIAGFSVLWRNSTHYVPMLCCVYERSWATLGSTWDSIACWMH